MYLFTITLVVAGAFIIARGVRIAFFRRRVESPFFSWRGPRAVAAGVALMALGAALIYAARLEASFHQAP